MYHSSGLPWATAAFKEAMVLAVEKPSLMIIQALESLQLYWFGIGEPYQGSLCLGKFPCSWLLVTHIIGDFILTNL
jgi:hypothetical protein